MKIKKKNYGTVLITGISASGKSTLGIRLKEDLAKNGITNIRLLDGEDIRDTLKAKGKEYGFSNHDRHEVIKEITQLAVDCNNEGIGCIICSICHEKATREHMHDVIQNVMEVYLNYPVDSCAKRDRKGTYEKAFIGLYDNFIGVTEPYQVSNQVDLILNTGENSEDECAASLIKKALEFFS